MMIVRGTDMTEATVVTMPRVWLEDSTTRPKAHFRNLADLRNAKLTQPQPLPANLPRIVIDITVGDVPDYFECGPLRLMSGRLVALLSTDCRPGIDIEFIPVDVFREEKKLEYWFGHVLAQVDCLDRERSRYTMADGMVDAIDHLEIDAGRAQGHRIFRVAKTYEYLVCVDAALSEQIKEASTGSVFVLPSEWRW